MWSRSAAVSVIWIHEHMSRSSSEYMEPSFSEHSRSPCTLNQLLPARGRWQPLEAKLLEPERLGNITGLSWLFLGLSTGLLHSLGEYTRLAQGIALSLCLNMWPVE